MLDVVGPSRDIEYDDLPKFKSIKRFLLESNRLFPVAPIISRNTVGEIDLGLCVTKFTNPSSKFSNLLNFF